jgi:hypothetical protein
MIGEKFSGNRRWPAQFSSVTPIMPSPGNEWWEYFSQQDGMPVESEYDDVFFLK